jgi:hypothetical protein
MTMPLTPDEIATWERTVNPIGGVRYRAIDQDPATIFAALYGQDTPPSDAERAKVSTMRDVSKAQFEADVRRSAKPGAALNALLARLGAKP